MKILLVGETGTGKTYTALSLSKFFNCVYLDTESGTELWLKHFSLDREKFRLLVIDSWSSYKAINSKIPESELICLDSLSTLQEHYFDYIQQYVRERKEFPMPTATGIVKLIKYDSEFIVMPMQLYQLLYDTMINVLDSLIRKTENLIVTMHPIETRQLSIDGQIIQSHGRQKFVQSIYRRMDIILHYTKPMQCKVIKARGFVDLPESVDPVQFLKQVLNVKE